MKGLMAFLAKYELFVVIGISPLLLFPIAWLPYLGLSVIILLWIARYRESRQLTQKTGTELPILLLIIMMAVGLFISVDKNLSAPRIWSIILGIAFSFSIINNLRVKESTVQVNMFFAILILGISFLGIFGTDWNYPRIARLGTIYEHIPTLFRGLPNSGIIRQSDLFNPRYVGITLGFLIPVSAATVLFGRETKIRLVSLLAVVVGGLALLLTQTVQGVFALVAGLFFILVWRSRWFLLLLPIGLLAIYFGANYIGLHRLAQLAFSFDNWLGIAVVLRLDIWSRAIAMLKDMPLTGIGTNTYSLIQSQFYPGYYLGPEPHAHNIYLQTALDFGLPGLFALIWLLVTWAIGTWKNYHATEKHSYRLLQIGISAGIIAYLFHGLIDALMLGAKPSVAIWIMLGIGISPILPTEALIPTRSLVRRISSQGLPVLLLVVMVLALCVFRPWTWSMNLGAIDAHLALYNNENPILEEPELIKKAYQRLSSVVLMQPASINANEILGVISSLEGNYPKAAGYFQSRINQDLINPFKVYLPSEYLLRKINGTEPASNQDAVDLTSVYSQWATRYPLRAEHYVKESLVMENELKDSVRAKFILELATNNGAKPDGLIEFSLHELELK